jgi:chemotaxis regulatin CheY-phosphate phosphatase CheZ
MSNANTLQEKIQNEISDLTNSISGMVSSFKLLHRPLVESREKVPQATNQLDKISEQTEAVTNKMLDVVEQITQREEDLIKGIGSIKAKVAAGEYADIDKLADDLAAKAGDNLNDAFQIMESLQFQDITAQQMDHAASLLEDVEEKLHSILSTLGATGLDTSGETTRKDRAYDPHADYTDKKTDQKDIDSLFAGRKA